jgi:FAD-dependent urate hydroxylase
MKALIVGGGIGGLSAAIALQKVGIEAVVCERAPQIAEVGAGLSLWSNAILAARRLDVEARVMEAGSVIEKTQSVLPSGELLQETDFSVFAKKFGAPSVCIHRAELQRVLCDTALSGKPQAVQANRKCVSFEENNGAVEAAFDDGSHEQADVLIGADGIHSVVRQSLLGASRPRYAGYFAWRGIAEGAGKLLPSGKALFVVGRGVQAGCFHCGEDRIYWFITCNAPQQSRPGPGGNKMDILATIENWRTPVAQFVKATEEQAILRNDIIDSSPQFTWGRGRVTLLGDAIHATTPNLGQGACQAMEDAVFLAHSLRTISSADDALRHYESSRRERTKFVVEQSWHLGKLLQLSNPLGVWLRDRLSQTKFASAHSLELFERLLQVQLPELDG